MPGWRNGRRAGLKNLSRFGGMWVRLPPRALFFWYNSDMKFTDKLEKQPLGTYKLEVSLPWSEVEVAKKEALDELQKTTEVKGFRKGKAPEKIVEEQVGQQKLLEEAARHLLSHAYAELIKKHNLRPFIDPKITLLKAPQGGDWEFRFEIAEAPVIVKVPDYRKIAKEVSGELKKEDIWVPGKGEKKEDQNKPQDSKNKKMQLIFDRSMKEAEIEISHLILDLEINRRLTALHDEIKQLGLTVEQYLESKKLSAEALREKTKSEIVDLYKSEFLLDKIADEEKIIVEDKDLESIYKTAKSDKEKEMLKNNSYLYARLIRKQKTLDFLAGL